MGTQNIIRMPSKICRANFYSFFPISFVPATSLVGARSTTTALDDIAVFCQCTTLRQPRHCLSQPITCRLRKWDRSDEDRGSKNRNGFEEAHHQLPFVTACSSISHADRWNGSTSAFEETLSSTSCHCMYLSVSNCQLFRTWEQKWFRGDLIYPLPPVPWFSQE